MPKHSFFRSFVLCILLVFCVWHLAAQELYIGAGSELHTGLPIEPLARYSYSQQLFTASEITISGEIHRISFQYQISSNNFLNTSAAWRIYLGHSSLQELNTWENPDAQSLVFAGNLNIDNFDAGIPGNGWLNVPLQNPFFYDGQQSLLLSVMDFSGELGYSGDDFYCFSSPGSQALNYLSLNEAIDFQNLPQPLPRAWRTNLILGFGAQTGAPRNLYGYHDGGQNLLFWQPPQGSDPSEYLIFRNAQSYGQSYTCSFVDAAIQPGEIYYYKVQARFSDDSLSGFSNEILIQVPQPDIDYLLFENFEELPAFSLEIPGWQNFDLNEAPKWGWAHTDFPHNGELMPWLVFAPALCTPPLPNISPVSGQNILLAAASMQPPNKDWLISPRVDLGENASLTFAARSYTAAYGLERLRVLISTAADATPESFLPLHSEEYLIVPAQWQEYNFDLSQYAGQNLCVALNCVSLDAMGLFIDDITLECSTANPSSDLLISPPRVKNYPNPAAKNFKLSSDRPFSAKIYNLRGQLVADVKPTKSFDSSALNLSAGLYFIHVCQKEQQYTLKQVILP